MLHAGAVLLQRLICISAAKLTRSRLPRCLESLEITRAPRLKDAHLPLLAPLAPTLRSLTLSGCGAELRGVTAAPALRALSSLRSLDLSHTGAPPGGGLDFSITSLLPGLSALTRLSLAGLGLDDAAAAGLEALADLRDLDLSDSLISGRFMEGALGGLTRLSALRLAHCAAGALPLFGSLKVGIGCGWARCGGSLAPACTAARSCIFRQHVAPLAGFPGKAASVKTMTNAHRCWMYQACS